VQATLKPAAMARRQAESGTVSIHFVREALQAVSGRGVPEARMLQAAGIPPGFLGEPLARVSPAQFGMLWRTLAKHLQDEFFALDARAVRPGAYALLCHTLLGCEDLRSVLRQLCRFTGIVLDGMSVRLDVTDGTATLRLSDALPRATPFAHATFFMAACGIACWLIARRIPILRCELGGHAPGFESEYRVMFCENLQFGAREGVLAMPASMLSMPVVQTREGLRAFLRGAPDVFLVKYRNMDSLAAQVRSRLRSIPPPDWPGLDDMAAVLGMAASTCRRRLDAEGTTFQAIKNALRRDMAINVLREDAMSIAELAHELGFTEASAFHRAFVKWTGMRPTDYRGGGSGPPPRAQ
jgi:AraC-like DNA-binding protein